MSSQYEQMIREAFAGLGSYSSLANGFRLQSPHGQSCAVYFSGNTPGNAVEIGLSPKALAPLIGHGETEIAAWVAEQAALTGRERAVSGQRGSFPGLALGGGKELKAFLDAWREFARPVTSNAVLENTRIEKAAEDAGFDLVSTFDGGWMLFRSSAFPHVLGVRITGSDRYAVGFSVASWGHKVAHDNATDARDSVGAWEAVIDEVVGFESLYWILSKAGALARLIVENEAAQIPRMTEAERLTTERVGQDMFRQSLIEYWHGRCAVTGLDVLGLLRASHIKPWAACVSDAERLDVFNGLLLAPHLDALFDGGWISFDDAGRVRVCDELSAEQRALLGLLSTWRLSEITDRHRAYLAWHRREVLRSGTGTK